MAFSYNRSLKIKPPASGESVLQLWKKVAAALSLISSFSNNVADLQRQIASLKNANANVLSGFYPFKIYQLPFYLRQSVDSTLPNYSDKTDWRKIRVRTGGCIVIALPNPSNPVQIHSIINVAGTDNATNLDVETFLDDSSVQDIVVPENDPAFAVWVTLTVTNGIAAFQLFSGDDPGGAGDNSGWDTFPENDQYHQLIGFVDSLTFADDNILSIRQITRSDMQFAIC